MEFEAEDFYFRGTGHQPLDDLEYFESERALWFEDPREFRGAAAASCSLDRYLSFFEFPEKFGYGKVCHYYNRGFCKHGNNCRFLHNDTCGRVLGNELEENMFSSQSLAEVEREITELLKSRRGNPVSIASLPMLYYEKYGKTLQAEGYLTESQRQGKVGYSLTKLLARLKSIRLIERPNGQHSVILAEDFPKYIDYIGEKGEKRDAGTSALRQIYITFPAASTFTEQDLSDYFNKNFGPVQDVRIPFQEKRQYGFVTFLFPVTVKHILSKPNRHSVGGANIIVKPYLEKSRPVDGCRKQANKLQQPMCPQTYCSNCKIHFLRACEYERLLWIQFQKQAIEVERRHISKMESIPTHSTQSSYLSMDSLNLSDGQLEGSHYPFAGLINQLMEFENSTVEDNNIPIGDSDSLNLPYSLTPTPERSIST